MEGNHYSDKEKYSFISLSGSSFAIQRMLGKCFEFLSATEGYVSDPKNDLTSAINLKESRVFFFSHPDIKNLRVSLLVGNISLSRTMLTVFVIDEANTFSDEERKQINITFSNALYYYLSNTLSTKDKRDRFSSNGCCITFIIFIIIFVVVYYAKN